MKKKDGIPNKVKLSEEAYSRLRWVKSKTNLEDWTIARLGLCFSFGDPTVPSPKKYGESNSKKEFNRFTLTGEFDLLYSELLSTYVDKYCSEEYSEADFFRAHLNRGIIALSRQIKGIGDLAELFAKSARA